MQKLTLPATKTTFGVVFDATSAKLELTGNSYPPNAMVFFEPLIHWLEEFVKEKPKEIMVIFRVNYFNTTSSKYIFKMLELLDKYNKSKNKVKLLWYYSESEDDLYESWKALISELDLAHQLIHSENTA